jgi:uncharacterized protein YdcH (DUF465 family)
MQLYYFLVVFVTVVFVLQRMTELNEIIKEAEKRQKEAEEERRKNLKERKLQLYKIHQYQMEYYAKYEQIVEVAKYVTYNKYLCHLEMNVIHDEMKSRLNFEMLASIHFRMFCHPVSNLKT